MGYITFLSISTNKQENFNYKLSVKSLRNKILMDMTNVSYIKGQKDVIIGVEQTVRKSNDFSIICLRLSV